MKNNSSIWHIMSFHAPLMTCLYLHQLAQTQSGCCVLSNHAYLWIWGSCTSGVELKQGTEKKLFVPEVSNSRHSRQSSWQAGHWVWIVQMNKYDYLHKMQTYHIN